MAEQSKIEWTDSTFNPWEGCTKVGPGCDHCYAENRNARFGGGVSVNWGPGAPRRRTSETNWRLPVKWNAEPFYQCASCGWRGSEKDRDGKFYHEGRLVCCQTQDLKSARRRVFCASLADWLDNEVRIEWRVDLLDLIARTPNLDWLMLTKRIGNWRDSISNALSFAKEDGKTAAADLAARWLDGYPPTNVWLGATIVNQQEADRDSPKLLQVPARARFLSMEPLLGPVDDLEWALGRPERFEGPSLDWVIVGGESGPGARPMHPDWPRSLRDQCADAGVPFLFKQWGEHSLDYDRDRDDPDYRRCSEQQRLPGRWINLAGGHGFHGDRVHYAHRVGKKTAGRTLDGKEWTQFPEVRE